LRTVDIKDLHVRISGKIADMGSSTQHVSGAGPRERDATLEAVRAANASADIFAGQTVMRLDSNDASELATRIPGWEVELTQLQPGPFSGHLIAIPLGPVLVCCGKFDQPLLQHVAGPRGCMIVNRPGRGSGPLRHLGHEVEDDECFVGGPASEGEAVGGVVQFPTALSVRLDAWEAARGWLGERDFLSARGTMLRKTGLPWATSFLDTMEWIVDAATRYPDSIARVDVRASLADLLLTRVDALGAGDFPVREDRQTRVHRRVAVERARRYIHSNLAEPIRLSHLCRFARTEARALEYGFQDLVGLSPIAYIRTTRLHRARGLLRSTAVNHRSISEIALDCGFWHLSQFAVDYKSLFGESPSITFRRTQAQLPAKQRRGQMQTTVLAPAPSPT
jgi:AraC family ethanolamine operon transcriptional activator